MDSVLTFEVWKVDVGRHEREGDVPLEADELALEPCRQRSDQTPFFLFFFRMRIFCFRSMPTAFTNYSLVRYSRNFRRKDCPKL